MIHGLAVLRVGKSGQERLSLALKCARACLHIVCVSRGCHAQVQLIVASKMPGAPTKSTADNMTTARQKVGQPSILGANPNSYFLKDINIHRRLDMFNGIFSLYMNGWFFRQKEVKEEFWTDDPTALTELLVKDVQWYEQHFRKVSKMLIMLLRHDNSRAAPKPSEEQDPV